MDQTITEEMIQAPFKINPELDTIIPKLVEEKFLALKADIKEHGLKVALTVMPDKTIIDGHNRYLACKQLGMKDFAIPFMIMPITSVQEALNYSIDINIKRRQLEPYPAGNWGLKTYIRKIEKTDKEETVLLSLKEIAQKVDLDPSSIGKIKETNEKIKNGYIYWADKAKKYQTELNSCLITFSAALKEMTTAEEVDAIIVTIDNPNGEVVKKIGKEKAKALKIQLQNEYLEKKFNVNTAKIVKELYKKIDMIVNPDKYKKAEKGYQEEVEKIAEKINALAEKYPDKVDVRSIDEVSKFDEAIAFLKENQNETSLFAMVTFFKMAQHLEAEQ